VILIDPLLVSGNRYFERIESLFDAIAASGVERRPAERRMRGASSRCATAFR
jgi:hypothetical protein